VFTQSSAKGSHALSFVGVRRSYTLQGGRKSGTVTLFLALLITHPDNYRSLTGEIVLTVTYLTSSSVLIEKLPTHEAYTFHFLMRHPGPL